MKYSVFSLLLLFEFVILDEYDDLPEDIRKYAEADEKCSEASDNKDLCFSKTSSINLPNFQCCIFDVQFNDDEEDRDIGCSHTLRLI